MTTDSELSQKPAAWSDEALALAVRAKVLSGSKLEQLVMRLQRHSGRSREACWRFIIQYGIKGKAEPRRWTDAEIDLMREELVKRSVDEVAKELHRTPKAVRNMLRRSRLSLRDIRCDRFSLASLATTLHVNKREILSWIKQGWLEAAVETRGKKASYGVTPEALTLFYKQHLADLLKRGIPNLCLFEAYLQYCYSPKHTVGEHLLDVRRDKRERIAYARLRENDEVGEGEGPGEGDRYKLCVEDF